MRPAARTATPFTIVLQPARRDEFTVFARHCRPLPAVGPPLPNASSNVVGLSILNADLLERMFRAMALEFSDLPVRVLSVWARKHFWQCCIKAEPSWRMEHRSSSLRHVT